MIGLIIEATVILILSIAVAYAIFGDSDGWTLERVDDE